MFTWFICNSQIFVIFLTNCVNLILLSSKYLEQDQARLGGLCVGGLSEGSKNVSCAFVYSFGVFPSLLLSVCKCEWLKLRQDMKNITLKLKVFLRYHCESTHSRHESLSFNANVLISCLKLFLLHGNLSFARLQWVTRSLPIWSRKPRRPHASCGTLLRSQTGTDQTNLSLVRKITAFLHQWRGGLDSAAVFLSL